MSWNKKSKILVTGHSGFVGRNLSLRLQKEEYCNVKCIDEYIVDLRDSFKTDLLFNSYKPDYVINLAAKVGGINKNINNQFEFMIDNLRIQNNIIQLCMEYGVKKCIIMGSSCMYPKDYKQPLKEEYLIQAPFEDTNKGYAIAKYAGCELANFANKKMGSNIFVPLMSCNLYGKYDHFGDPDAHVIPALIDRIASAKRNNNKEVVLWGSGQQRREFFYVEDLIDCYFWILDNDIGINDSINVGLGKDMSLIKLANMIADLMDYDGEIVPDIAKPEGMKLRCLDVSKINEKGWTAKTDIETGVKQTVKWYRENVG